MGHSENVDVLHDFAAFEVAFVIKQWVGQGRTKIGTDVRMLLLGIGFVVCNYWMALLNDLLMMDRSCVALCAVRR